MNLNDLKKVSIFALKTIVPIVGIGTTVPGATLDVKGSLKSEVPGTNGVLFFKFDPSAATPGMTIGPAIAPATIPTANYLTVGSKDINGNLRATGPGTTRAIYIPMSTQSISPDYGIDIDISANNYSTPYGVRAIIASSPAAANPAYGFYSSVTNTNGVAYAFYANQGASYFGGNVGIGTTGPTEKLHVVGNLRVQGSTDCTLGNGAGGTNCSSDIRLKENVQEIDNSLEKILSLRGVEFDWNQKSQSPGDHAIGVIAQDVEKVFPTAVIDDPGSGYKKVDYAVLVAPVIQAFKELNKRITELFNTAERHSREIASVKADNAQIKLENAQLKHDNAKKTKELEEVKVRLDKIEKMLKSR